MGGAWPCPAAHLCSGLLVVSSHSVRRAWSPVLPWDSPTDVVDGAIGLLPLRGQGCRLRGKTTEDPGHVGLSAEGGVSARPQRGGVCPCRASRAQRGQVCKMADGMVLVVLPKGAPQRSQTSWHWALGVSPSTQAGRTQSVGLGVPSGSPRPVSGCLLSTGPQARLRGLHLPCGHSRRCVGSESPEGPRLGLVQGQTRIRGPDTWAAAPGVSTADRSL